GEVLWGICRGAAASREPRRVSLRERVDLPVLQEESFAMGRGTESFRAARAGSGECSGFVSAGQAGRQIAASQVLMKESGVEAVAGADGVDRVHQERGTDKSFVSSLRQGSLAAELHDKQRH